MPLPLVPLIIAGASLIGSIWNASSQAKSNKRQLQWNEQMYDRQRRDALTDQAFQNDYNSPAAQMERLKAGGLNPNLVYGNGATTLSSTARSSAVESYKPIAPQIDIGGASRDFFAAYDVQLKKAQTDNIAAAIEVSKQDAILRAAQVAQTVQQTAATKTQTEQGKFNLQLAEKLEQNSLEKSAVELDKLKADTQFTLDQNERQAALTKSTIGKAAEEVLNLRAQRAQTEEQRVQIQQQIKNLKAEETLKQLDINLKRMGIQPSDPAWMRIIQQLVDPGTKISDFLKNWHKFIPMPFNNN